MSDSKESEVGYGKPPKASRFRKGQSGNPSGKRKRRRSNVDEMLAEQLKARITVTEDGVRKTVTKLQVMMLQAVNAAMAGNFKPLQILTKLRLDLEQVNKVPVGDEVGQEWTPAELAKLTTQELTDLYKAAIAKTRPL